MVAAILIAEWLSSYSQSRQRFYHPGNAPMMASNVADYTIGAGEMPFCDCQAMPHHKGTATQRFTEKPRNSLCCSVALCLCGW